MLKKFPGFLQRIVRITSKKLSVVGINFLQLWWKSSYLKMFDTILWVCELVLWDKKYRVVNKSDWVGVSLNKDDDVFLFLATCHGYLTRQVALKRKFAHNSKLPVCWCDELTKRWSLGLSGGVSVALKLKSLETVGLVDKASSFYWEVQEFKFRWRQYLSCYFRKIEIFLQILAYEPYFWILIIL